MLLYGRSLSSSPSHPSPALEAGAKHIFKRSSPVLLKFTYDAVLRIHDAPSTLRTLTL